MTRGDLEREQKKGAECSCPGLLSQVGFAEPPSPDMPDKGK